MAPTQPPIQWVPGDSTPAGAVPLRGLYPCGGSTPAGAVPLRGLYPCGGSTPAGALPPRGSSPGIKRSRHEVDRSQLMSRGREWMELYLLPPPLCAFMSWTGTTFFLHTIHKIKDDFFVSSSNFNWLTFVIIDGLEYLRNYSMFVSVLECGSFDDVANISDCVT